jgi:hypothetical protein
MEENLVGYLLGALDPVTHQRVEAYLRGHPEARARLANLEAALSPLAEDREPPEPPSSLVVNTLARVAAHQRHLPEAPTPSRHQVGTPPRRWARRADWVVAASVLILAGGMLFPLLAARWHTQQRTLCANNLRQLWVSLSAYADREEGPFPRVEPEGPRAVAGIFVPVLQDVGLLCGVSVACPAEGRREPARYGMRELEEMFRDQPEAYRQAVRDLSGSYAYTLGYREGGTLLGLNRESGDHLPILADRAHPDGRGNSPNHGGSGQNVLYVGGNVRWCVQSTVGPNRDDIYINQHYQVSAGLHRSDCVLGVSNASPEKAN